MKWFILRVGVLHFVVARILIRVLTEQATEQATDFTEAEKRIILILDKELKRSDIQEDLGLKHRMNFISNYLNPALEDGYIEMTIPEIPTHQEQRYRLTTKGKLLKNKLQKL